MALTLTYQASTTVPVELEGFLPEVVCEQSLAEIEKFPVQHGNQQHPIAEYFKLSGDPSDQKMHFEGDLSGVHWIGTEMSTGEIVIEGNAGRHVGSEMRGGSIRVQGNVSDWLGGEMKGGLIHVKGNAGHLVGAAYRGSRAGMRGGTILVEGDAGNEIGLSMRRGMIAIGGNAGDAVGFNMIAGTVFVFGEAGIRPGAGMRRGTIALFGEPLKLLPTFHKACEYQPQFLQHYLRELKQLGFNFNEDLYNALYTRYSGDLVALGKGEVLMRC